MNNNKFRKYSALSCDEFEDFDQLETRSVRSSPEVNTVGSKMQVDGRKLGKIMVDLDGVSKCKERDSNIVEVNSNSNAASELPKPSILRFNKPKNPQKANKIRFNDNTEAFSPEKAQNMNLDGKGHPYRQAELSLNSEINVFNNIGGLQEGQHSLDFEQSNSQSLSEFDSTGLEDVEVDNLDQLVESDVDELMETENELNELDDNVELDEEVQQLLNENDFDGETNNNTETQSIKSYKSAKSSSSGVKNLKWKAVVEEVFAEENSQNDNLELSDRQNNQKEMSALESLISALESLKFIADPNNTNNSSEKPSLEDEVERCKSLAEESVKEQKRMVRQHKNENLKLRATIERLNEKVEVNIHLDDRIKVQNRELQKMKQERDNLMELVNQNKFNKQADDTVLNEKVLRLETENMEQMRKLEKLTKKADYLRKKNEKLKKEVEEQTSTANETGSSTRLEQSKEVFEVLKTSLSGVMKANENLVKTNDNLLEVNKILREELVDNKRRFEEEQNQWQRNYELLKLHFEVETKEH